jgi:hypothetical protein
MARPWVFPIQKTQSLSGISPSPTYHQELMASIDASVSARDNALARVSAGHLHQCLWLPETQDHPRLRVTFATTTNFDNESLPAILFIPPMFGSRWFVLEMDKLARDSGVRVVFPDRYYSYVLLVLVSTMIQGSDI